MPPRDAPGLGALIGISLEADPAWLVVEGVEFVEAEQSPLQTSVSVRGELWRLLSGRPPDAPRRAAMAARQSRAVAILADGRDRRDKGRKGVFGGARIVPFPLSR